ncbi:hypothetical protein [Acinetobacter pollinis]|uniref:hypothetical protein n=1 Tax=Acinetobacter pollinis TaxID=2605270 RepID=UPI0018C29B36|nr:hypothetical protein [Acinetobacter pollinis]MBF7694184.1 hypothetical protein [Acinetobacter pollinis]MBF7701782.1 hypothetical protein [Acinetobacter pollinis]
MLKFHDFIEIHKKAHKYLNSIQNKVELTKKISEENIQGIIKGEGITRAQALKLLEKFDIQYKNSSNKKHSEIYSVLKFMFNSKHCENAYTADQERLTKAYAYTIIFIEEYKPIGLTPSDSDEMSCLFKSIEYFRKKGYKVTIKDGTLIFNSMAKVALKIDENLKQLGLLGVIGLIGLLPRWENSNIYKFPDASSDILIPFGFIFNKALKHLYQTGISEYKAKRLLQDTFELAKHYVSLYGVQKYSHSQISYMYSDTKKFLKLLGNQVICDQAFKIEQYDPSSLFAFIDYVKNQYNYSEIDYLHEISHYILECGINIPVQVNEKLLELDEKYSDRVQIDMQSLLVHKNVNQDFNFTHDFSSVNYNTKPFVRMKNKDIFFLNHNFFYLGFYHVLSEILYQKGKKEDQGFLIESFAESQLGGTNENFIIGEKKYKVSKDMRSRLDIKSEELESDMVIYNDEKIVFLEVKLRPLTKQSKGGNGYSLLNDFTESLVRSQTQLNKHVRYLKENDCIQFESKELLEYKNKRIYKFSVSSLDYQGLSSRLIYVNLLKLIPSFTVDTNREYQEQVNSINKNFKKFCEEIKKNKDGYGPNDPRSFFDTGFISVFQLIFLIHRSKQKNIGLIDTIVENINMVSDQTDFYYHYKRFD